VNATKARGGQAAARESSPPFRVLFLCTHNSARSQIAEAVLRKRGGDRFEVASAGSEPSGAVHPLALRLIEQIGGDPEAHRSKGLDEVLATEWDLVITVCDQAAEACPVLPGRTVSAHWGVPDPSKVEGSEERRAAAFRDAYSALAKRIELFVALGPEKIERMVLRNRLAQIHREAERRPGSRTGD
jgi:arsenate reductase